MVEADIKQIKQYLEKGIFQPQAAQIIEDFYQIYLNAIPVDQLESGRKSLDQWLKLVVQYIQKPFNFEIFHRAIRTPFDFYQFGLDFMRPLIDFQHSKVMGKKNIDQIAELIEKNENVILLANHQTEPDPQIISLMLEKSYPRLASDMIFVAGDRVTSDPLAVPMSLGRNLLCIYSKKHMDTFPEEKANKVLHNRRTLKKMLELLSQGGQCIYAAPSGGRDRPNTEGIPEVSPFDPDSLELFWLMAKQALKPTHFFTLALKTYNLMPPPVTVERELGEKRYAAYTPVYLMFGKEVEMQHFPNSDDIEKRAKRAARAEYIGNLVKKDYQSLC